MTERLWCSFVEAGLSESGKTRVWSVLSGEIRLGRVAWYAPWRKYAFFPVHQTLYEQDCLRQLAGFCESMTRAHRATVKALATA